MIKRQINGYLSVLVEKYKICVIILQSRGKVPKEEVLKVLLSVSGRITPSNRDENFAENSWHQAVGTIVRPQVRVNA